jgi:UrcA family protein
VKKSVSIRKTRQSILPLAATALLAIPMLASAGVATDSERSATILFDTSEGGVNSSESLYARLKAESRKICGDSSIYLTGSVRRSAGIEECYEGTLTAAVERLDDADVSALHRKESS